MQSKRATRPSGDVSTEIYPQLPTKRPSRVSKIIMALALNELDQFPRRGRAKLRLSRGFTLGLAQQHRPYKFSARLFDRFTAPE